MTSSGKRDGQQSLPAGQQPYDALNGIRVGVIAGSLLGLIAVAVLGAAGMVVVLLLGAAGGVIGYAWERSDQRRS